MALIFYASEGGVPDSNVNLFPSWTLEWIYHGAAFGGLAALTYAALRVSLPWNWQTVALLSLAVAVVYGLTDEWHQGYVSNRSSDIRDVGRDAIGAVVVILLAHATFYSIDQLLRKQWGTVWRVVGGTVATLQGLIVMWLVALWMLAGSENSFSLGSLREGEFQAAIVKEPLALAVAMPFLGVALWFSLGLSRTLGSGVAALLATSLSTLVLLSVPFLTYGFNVIPDRAYVWIATWVASAAAWALLGWPLIRKVFLSARIRPLHDSPSLGRT